MVHIVGGGGGCDGQRHLFLGLGLPGCLPQCPLLVSFRALLWPQCWLGDQHQLMKGPGGGGVLDLVGLIILAGGGGRVVLVSILLLAPPCG